jgi:BASS family bile acid:Na+ symporter
MNGLLSWLPTATLFAMMLSLGLTLAPQDFRRVLTFPAVVAVGLGGQLVVLPLVAFGLAWGWTLPPPLALGLVLIAACPGGVTSNVFTWLARGDVALSITLTAVSNTVSFATVPFVVALGTEVFGGELPALDLPLAETFATLFGTTAAPVAFGMILRARRPNVADRVHRPLLKLSTAVLLLLIAGLAASTARTGYDLEALAVRVTPAVVLLLAIGTTAGAFGARLVGGSAAVSRTLALEIGMQNVNLGLVVAVSLLGEPRYAGPSLIYLPVMLVFAAGIVAWGRWSQAVDPAPRRGMG